MVFESDTIASLVGRSAYSGLEKKLDEPLVRTFFFLLLFGRFDDENEDVLKVRDKCTTWSPGRKRPEAGSSRPSPE